MTKKKKEDRIILIDANFICYIENLLRCFSSQLSDGYWENSGGEWSTDINDNYCAPYWNYLEFKTKYPMGSKRPYLTITIKTEPIYKECEDIYSSMTDKEVMNYIIENLEEAYNEAPCAFYQFNDYEIKILIDSLKHYTMHPKPLPKLTHEELVKKLGYNFEYSG